MKKISKFFKENKGVFGLDSVRLFFLLILGIALLAYVIVIIMGTLQTSTILQYASNTITNESGYINVTGDALNKATTAGFLNPAITAIYNSTGILITSGNYSLNGTIIYGFGVYNWSAVNISYTYSYYSNAQLNSVGILGNVSNGTTGFFTSINPVYAILAVLVIILVLVVLVRVVSGGNYQGQSNTPQL